jgi:group I intron endonuclease
VYGIIYKATGPGGKVYVGQTVKTLNRRKGQHKFRTKKGDRRDCFHVALLDEGFDKFTWEQIDTAETPEELDAKEKQWIAYYRSNDPEYGYNISKGGPGSSCRPSEETRRKLSEAHKGLQAGEKHPLWGKHPSLESRRKMSEAHKNISPETRRRMIEAQKKRPPASEETRHKMSEVRKGKTHTEETRHKISEAQKGEKNHMFGKHLSAETIGKLSEAWKGEKHPKAKLTEVQVVEILQKYKKGAYQREIAKEYGVSRATIEGITSKRTWTHVSM